MSEKERSVDADEPLTQAEHDLMKTVQCQHRHCSREVYKEATVDVAVGKMMEENNTNVRLSGVGLDVNKPNIEKWCMACADEEFGINEPAGERSISETNEYLTIPAIIGFLFGVMSTMLVMSVIVV